MNWWEELWANVRAFFMVVGTIMLTIVTAVPMMLVRELSHFTFDLGWVLPCWDIIAWAGGVCR